jgi:hypothetical protein
MRAFVSSVLCALFIFAIRAAALAAPLNAATVLGPYNAEFPAGGDGLAKPLPGLLQDVIISASEPWTLSGWIAPSEMPSGEAIIAGVGHPARGGRFLTLRADGVGVWTGRGEVSAKLPLHPNQWRFVAATSDGARISLYVDGARVGEGAPIQSDARATALLAPRGAVGFQPYAGRIADFTMERQALTAVRIKILSAKAPNPDVIVFDTGSPHWPVQTHQMYGQIAPQNAWTLPKSTVAASTPIAKAPYSGPELAAAGEALWTLKRWTLAEAPKVAAPGEAISRPGFGVGTWYAATVPGTVLTTMVDRGVYPDPDYGLNNLAIPESLNKQDYWYRSEFETPREGAGRHAMLTFKGINYAAEIWLNGFRIGTLRGAFIRGRFDVTGKLNLHGLNALAVRISPPPHPGIAQEESLSAGPGENGGMEALDGPTFVASEGWDWIPSVRDRNTGLWQDVTLGFTDEIRLGDAQVITTLPHPDNRLADVEIDVPAENLSAAPRVTTVTARFGAVALSRTVTLAPGSTMIKFDQASDQALAIHDPDLWWPNGYGAQTLQHLILTADVDGKVSDRKTVRFGIRQITYELSLMDPTGHVRRVNVDFARARALGQTVLDVRHEAIRKIPDGWVETLTEAGSHSPAVTDAKDGGPAPYLTLKVNGARIAAKGGSWGTDDWRKRVDRERLEPYFRLHKEANLNVIRNWVGQNTEDVFYDLADEYGLLVLNDFWASTQDYQLEPEDVPLFLANAADVVARYRNHPSIALWFGRNEGVPQPILNEGLEKLTRELDGTRWYTGSSNRIGLQDSGPYNYRAPEGYFGLYSKGFAVEVGTPSFPTLEAFDATIAPGDRWPISDAWAYHDWHQTGNGAVASFLNAMTDTLGAPKSLDDFERKAQLMNYETYRAIFEGLNAGLWSQNSGRLLWMTQPAWPSTMWQIFSHDYDTHAAFYGTKAGSERVHAQLNLASHQLDVVNNGFEAIKTAALRARVLAVDGRVLSDQSWPIEAAADATTHGGTLALNELLRDEGAVVVRLDLTDASGASLSKNLYWLRGSEAGGRKLQAMAAQPVSLLARLGATGGERTVRVSLRNKGTAPALNAKLTLLDGKGARILPAYYSDNYVSLLPGEAREIDIRYSAAADVEVSVALRGWNVAPLTARAAP